MATTTDVAPAQTSDASPARDRFSSAWVIAGFALLLLLVLGWRFLADPSLSAPTRDPAWYTWRANVVMESDPGSVVGEWGPGGLFSGGYRVTTLVSGALLQRVAGIDTYSFSAFLMLGMPVLTGMALGAGAFRSRKHGLVVLLTMLVTTALFLTTPYVGYLDNITVLFLLSLLFPFLERARTSWGARSALFLVAMAAAFTHPTTCVLFGVTMMGVFGFHFLTARFRFGPALNRDAPALWSVGVGMIVGLASWVIGIWGTTASLKDAALPPPYTKSFFVSRLGVWFSSMQPAVIVPLIVIAIGGTILLSRRTRRPADAYDVTAAWWLLPLIGVFTFVAGTDYQISGAENSPVVPYYRFINATAAPMALAGLGAFALIMWFWRREQDDGKSTWLGLGIAVAVLAAWFITWKALSPAADEFDSQLLGELWIAFPLAAVGILGAIRPRFPSWDARKVIAVLASVLVIFVLAHITWFGTRGSNWVSDGTQWANQEVRTSLAAVHEVVAAAGERPNVLIMNYSDTNDETQTNTAYGWAKTWTNIFRTGVPGDSAKYSVTYMGTIENYLAGQQTTGGTEGYNSATAKHYCEAFGWSTDICGEEPADFVPRFQQYPEDPVAFVIGQFYKGPENPTTNLEGYEAALDAGQAVEVGPDVYVLTAPGQWTPPDDVIARAHAAADAEAAKFVDHPSAWENPLHTLRVLFGLLILMILPGLLARKFFEIDDSPVARVALIPGISIVLSMLSAIVVLSVWRGPMGTTKGWVIAGVAVGAGALLGGARERILRPLESFGNFWNKLFGAFSNPDFSVLMGMQFLAQAGQGVVQGAIGKAIAFGGKEGFDVQNVPSADYLLKVVLFLYLPYTLLSPFIGVFIDRFARRRVVWWTNIITSAVVVVVAVLFMLPLGKDTSAGNTAATIALIVGLLAAQACVRVALAVKSAAIPDVLSGKDLLQGNGLSQAGGALFQVVGIAFALGFAAVLPAWVVVVLGAGVLVIAALVAKRMQHVEARPHETSFGQEAAKVIRNMVAGLRELVSRPPAALGLMSFQMLRYQFWGFGLFVFGLYAKNLVQGGDADSLSLAISGLGGLVGGAIGLVLAQKWKDKVPPIRLLLASMLLLGVGTLVFGALVSKLGFALMLFTGFFAFFLGKISADTIVQQSMPDDFRGRAFALFDIAYNVGFIVPALILSIVWVEGSATRTRAILIASGIVFIGLTALVWAWSRRIRDQFASQDDLVATP
jgi:MFS family permease